MDEILHAIECECHECLDKWKKLEQYPKHWSKTDEGKQQLLDIINGKFSFDKQGNIYCRECKNESVACVCIGKENG